MTRPQAPARHTTGWEILLFLIVAAFIMGLVAFGAWWLAAQISGPAIPFNPFLAFGHAKYRALWSPLATVFAVIADAALIGAALWIGMRLTSGSELDKRAAHSMAAPSDLSEIAGRSAVEKARRLRPDADLTDPAAIGLHLGTTVRGGVRIVQSWEDVLTAVSGTRTGKTAGVAVGSVIDAPGPVIATSNKRDLRDLTRGVREERGCRVWESDLQGITGEPHQEWWWNPFGNVSTLASARRLAERFVSAERAEDSRTDSYFDGGAKDLIALYFLAAAVGGGDILHSFAWLSDEDNDLPARLLDKSGNPVAADKVRTAIRLNPRQRDGVYDVARRNLNVLTEPRYLQTVLPPQRHLFPDDETRLGSWSPTHKLPEFDPAAFVRSTDALYALSMEGADSATALVTALTGRLIDEALVLARRSPGGRLVTPFVLVLDEAANVCKLSELPEWYSHLGSQGIICQTYLQSLAQAAKVWTPKQLDMLLGASNVHYYGGGGKDTNYLSDVAQAIGNRDVQRWSTSVSNGGRSHSQSWSAELAVPVSMLAELDKDRAVIMSTGNQPVLVRKAWWTERPDAAAIKRSRAKYDPGQKVKL
ncbi:TraM recognition domain-containing protein [Nocardia sp. NPDC004582]